MQHGRISGSAGSVQDENDDDGKDGSATQAALLAYARGPKNPEKCMKMACF